MDQASSSLTQLRWKWHRFAVAALGFAYVLVRLERAGARDLWAKAHTLEIIALVAYTDVCRAARGVEPGDPETDAALAHLNTIALSLLAIALSLLAIALSLLAIALILQRMNAGLPGARGAAFDHRVVQKRS